MIVVRRFAVLFVASLLLTAGLVPALPVRAQTPELPDAPGESVPAPIPTLPSRPAALPTLPAQEARRPALETAEAATVPATPTRPVPTSTVSEPATAPTQTPTQAAPGNADPSPATVATQPAGAPAFPAPSGPPVLPTAPPSPTATPTSAPTAEASPTATPGEPATATPRPRGPVAVPNVVGRPEAEARRLIEEAGLVNGYTNYQRLEDVPDRDHYLATAPGSVLSQQPGGGQTIDPGTTVLLAVADPADPRPAPSPITTAIAAGATVTGTAQSSPTPAATLAPASEEWLDRADPSPTDASEAEGEEEAEDEVEDDEEDPTGETVGLGPGEADGEEEAIDPGTPDPLPLRVRPAPLVLSLSGPERSLLSIPGRLQLDGSPYQRANCGVASLGMILSATGIDYPTASLRALANRLQAPRSYLDGLAWETLTGVAGQFGLQTRGLYAGGYYRRWTFQDLHDELIAGHPVITLVHYQMLPANWNSTSESDHYIVLTGFDGSDFIYNDSAPFTGTGVGTRLNAADLLAAWDTSSLPRSAMAVLSPEGVIGLDPAATDGEPAAPAEETLPEDFVPHDPGQQYVDVEVEESAFHGTFLPPAPTASAEPAVASAEPAVKPAPGPPAEPVEVPVEPATETVPVAPEETTIEPVPAAVTDESTMNSHTWSGWLIILGGSLALATAFRPRRGEEHES